MLHLKALLLLAACVFCSHCKVDYCALDKEHTMCMYSGLGKNCVDPGGSGVSREERKEIVDVHNWARRKVASGEETRGVGGPQPKAANMLKMTWDRELSRVAQRWADQCVFSHDAQRSDSRWGAVGQNIYWFHQYPKKHINWKTAVLTWFDEVSSFSPEEVNGFSEGSKSAGVIGHYTQLLWHDTHMVGCGRRDYGNETIAVCNYGPSGNWLSEPVYAVGEPCSKCPAGTSCDNSLCELPKVSKTNNTEAYLSSEGVKREIVPDESNADILEPAEEKSENSSEGLETKPHSIQNQIQDNQSGDKESALRCINNCIDYDLQLLKSLQKIFKFYAQKN